jgi:hypothetical protein
MGKYTTFPSLFLNLYSACSRQMLEMRFQKIALLCIVIIAIYYTVCCHHDRCHYGHLLHVGIMDISYMLSLWPSIICCIMTINYLLILWPCIILYVVIMAIYYMLSIQPSIICCQYGHLSHVVIMPIYDMLSL